MTNPTQIGSRLNVWAMIKSLVAENMGFYVIEGAPTSGSAGTYAGYMGKGAVLIDKLTGNMYVNNGTVGSPTWQSLGMPTSANAGLGAAGNAKMTYDFAVDGGAVGVITPSNSPTLPVGAIILGGTVDITTQVTSGGAATIALGLGSGAQAAALKAATAVATYSPGQMAVIPVFTAASYVKVAAATRLTLSVAAFALTAGKFDVNVLYVQGNV